MLLQTIIFLLTQNLLQHALKTEECEQIKCGTSDENMSTEYENSVLKIGQCDPGYKHAEKTIQILTTTYDEYNYNFCNPISQECGTDLGAGQSCCYDNNCASDNCQNGKCIGKDGGSDCKISEQCKPNYWCNNRICSEITTVLGDECSGDNQCPAGSGCNYGICTKLVSLDIGESAQTSKFCKSGYEVNNVCDELVVELNYSPVQEPFTCDIGQWCRYKTKFQDEFIERHRCPCNGIEGQTQSNCFFSLHSRGNRNYPYQIMQYDSSQCSGYIAHSLDFENAWRDCGHYTLSQIEEWNSEVSTRQLWPLYQSGAIVECIDSIKLPDQVTITSSDIDENEDTGGNEDTGENENTEGNEDTGGNQDTEDNSDTEQDNSYDDLTDNGPISGNYNSSIGLAVSMLSALLFQFSLTTSQPFHFCLLVLIQFVNILIMIMQSNNIQYQGSKR